MKRLFFVGLLGLLFAAAGWAQSEAFIVTDFKGIPTIQEPGQSTRPVRLLGKLSEGEIKVKSGDSLTLTMLTNGQRTVLSGPVSGHLSKNGFRRVAGASSSVKILPGRITTTDELKNVSSTMGAVSVRVGEPLLLTTGAILDPQIAWLPMPNYPACKITIEQDGEVIKQWPWVDGDTSTNELRQPSIISLEGLNLQEETPYFISFTPVRKEEDGRITEDVHHSINTDFKLVNREVAEEAFEKKDKAWELYQEDPSDLTPLTSYLAFLWHNNFLTDAIRLVHEPAFQPQAGTRTVLLTQLKGRYEQKSK
ncbi:MAG: hypothetical protein WC314_12855 [Vulcanimicrobiota bacterium]